MPVNKTDLIELLNSTPVGLLPLKTQLTGIDTKKPLDEIIHDADMLCVSAFRKVGKPFSPYFSFRLKQPSTIIMTLFRRMPKDDVPIEAYEFDINVEL